MKRILFLLIIPSLLYSSTIELLTAQIDSLTKLKNYHQTQVTTLENEIYKLEREKTSLQNELIDKNKENAISQGIVTGAKMNGKIRNKPNSNGTTLIKFLKNDSLIVYEFIDDYFKCKYKNTLGYVHEMYLNKSPMIQSIIKDGKEKLANERNAKNQKELQKRKKALVNKYGYNSGIKIFENKIWLGMTKEMAIESWGKPKDINRTVTNYGTREQWIYSNTYLYFENGKLTSWQD